MFKNSNSISDDYRHSLYSLQHNHVIYFYRPTRILSTCFILTHISQNIFMFEVPMIEEPSYKKVYLVGKNSNFS